MKQTVRFLPTMMSNEKFQAACDRVIGTERLRETIGTLSEKTVHAVLKQYFEPCPENQEVKIGTYYADIVGEDGIIEIQTGSFQQLRKKLMEFLAVTRVTVVYPIPRNKLLRTIDRETGEITAERKSPKHGNPHFVFPELCKIRTLLTKPNFTLCVVLLDLCEYRLKSGKQSVKFDRIPTDLLEEIYFFSPADYAFFLPPELPPVFTGKDYAALCKIPLTVAQSEVRVLTELGLLNRAGKRGNAFLYCSAVNF